MFKAGIMLLCAELACACGSSDDGSFDCTQADRVGTYYLDFETLSGDCGEQTDGLVQVGNPDPSCANLEPPRLSDGECKLETHISCDLGSLRAIEARAVTTQQDENADLVTGTVTFVATEAGSVVCTGTYRVTYTRQ